MPPSSGSDDAVGIKQGLVTQAFHPLLSRDAGALKNVQKPVEIVVASSVKTLLDVNWLFCSQKYPNYTPPPTHDSIYHVTIFDIPL